MKYTPGPWEVEEAQGSVFVNQVVGASVALVLPQVRDWPLMENARLIAAAPELLEACKALEKYLTAEYVTSKTIFQLHDKLRAAIAKAEGVQG